MSYLSQWNPSTYFPEQVEEKIADKTEARFPGKTFDDLNENEKDLRQKLKLAHKLLINRNLISF